MVNSKKIGKGNRGLTGSFSSLPATQDSSRRPGSECPVPSDEQVKEARDWVNHNKK